MQRAGLWFGSLLLTALLLEGGARAVLLWLGDTGAPVRVGWDKGEGRSAQVRDLVYVPDPELFFRLAPNLEVARTGNPRIFDLRTDSRGLRSDEPALPKPGGITRVLATGDSCTFGSGAGQADTWPAQLERELGKGFEVLNAGVPGFTSHQALRFLETEGFALEPDAVVFTTGVNDASPATAGPRRRFGAELLLSDREYAAALQSSARLGITRLMWRAGLGPGAVGSRGEQPGGVKRRVSPGEYRANLAVFAEAARRRGALPVVAIWPLRTQVERPPTRGEVEQVIELYQEAARALARERGVLLVDLVPAFAGRADLFVDAVHLGPEGYRRVAEQVAEALRTHLPLEGNPQQFQGNGTFSQRREEIASPTSASRPHPKYRQQHPLPKRSGPFPSREAARSRWSAAS